MLDTEIEVKEATMQRGRVMATREFENFVGESSLSDTNQDRIHGTCLIMRPEVRDVSQTLFANIVPVTSDQS